MHGRQGTHTNRSQAVEKAMKMKIKKVPWWNKRSRLERRLVLTVLVLVLLVSILIAALVLTVQSFSDVPLQTQNNSSASREKLVFSVKEVQTVNQIGPEPSETLTGGTESKYCLSKECIQTAAELADRMDIRADPCEDFYQFACGGYVKKTIIPEDRSRTSMFSDVGDKLNKQIKGMLEQEISPYDPKPYKLAKSLYQSCMDTSTIEARGIHPLLTVLRSSGGWPLLDGEAWEAKADQFKWYEMVYRFRDLGYSVDYLLDFSVTADLRNSTWRVLDLDQPSLGLSREILMRGLQDGQVGAYFTYMTELVTMLGAERKQAELQMLEVLIFETQLANISLSRESRRDSSSLYNPMTVKELSKLDSQTPWLEYLNRLLTKDIIQVTEDEVIVVDVPSYIRDLGALLRVTPARVLANYLMWRAAASSFPYLSHQAELIRLRFSTAVSGRTELPPRWMKCVSTTTSSLPNAVGSLYVRQYFNGNSKNEAEEMVNKITEQFLKMLGDVNWMDESTKAAAIHKAKAMTTHIGYPPELVDMQKLSDLYSGLEMNKNDFFGNALRTTIFGTNYAFSKLREKVDKLDWVRHGRPAVVNAFYSPLENSIQFPAGILQGVFFNSERPKYMNYGAIGWVIGHEITHGFDDQGRQFDKDGNLLDWWQEETKQKYFDRTKCIISQYGNYSLPELGNLVVNGVSTQGENVADNGGIKQAYNAYQSWAASHAEEPRLPGLGFTQSQLFWLSGAGVWCAKYRHEALRLRVLTGVHSPDMFRVQGPFSNMDEFARDFQCPIGSKMNPPKQKKCELW